MSTRRPFALRLAALRPDGHSRTMRLAALHDDATCAVLQFVPAGDVAQFVAPACKRLRDLGRSDALLMLRRASDYHLRGDRATDSGAAPRARDETRHAAVAPVTHQLRAIGAAV